MKRIFIAFFLVAASLGYSQQDAQFSMNMFNRLAVNPAYAGINKSLCVTTLYRNQWVGFKDDYTKESVGPKTGLLSLDYGKNLGWGLGLTVDQDQIGLSKTLNAKLAYARHFMFYTGNLSLGIDAGMMQQSISGNFIAPDGSSSLKGGGLDPSIPWTGSRVLTYDIGFGAYYFTRTMYIGLSSLHLPQQEVAKGNYLYQVSRHYYMMAGYNIIDNRDWVITPSIFTKSVLATTQVDVNIMAKWRRTIFGGVSYRVKDAIIAMAGIERNINRYSSFKLGYAYDVPGSDLKKHNNGSHEIMLGFCYKFVPEGTITSHMNVRFL